MNILKLKSLNPTELYMLYKTHKFSNTEFKHIFHLLALQPLTISHIPLIKKLLDTSHQIIYCYEVKKLLQENDENLFNKYANLFVENPGCNEAFNIESVNRKPYVKILEKSEIKMLEPAIYIKKRKVRDNQKKLIRRNARILADKKNKELIEEGKKYKRKLAKMYSKLSSNK